MEYTPLIIDPHPSVYCNQHIIPNMKHDHTITTLGGTCAIFMGVSYFLGGASYLLNSARQAINNYTYWESLAKDNRAEILFHFSLALVGLFGLAVVPAVTTFFNGRVGQWFIWINNLAYVGFGVSLIEHLRAIRILPEWTKSFMADAINRPAIVSTHLSLELDPDHWLQFGVVGLWVFMVSWLAGRDQLWSKTFTWLGLCTAVSYWLVVFGIAFRTSVLILVGGSVGGLILMPIWYIWLGRILRK